jgi:2,5-dihydroxypyridine 5,6-dioxygenase
MNEMNLHESPMLAGARKLLSVCTHTQAGQCVTIVTDHDRPVIAEVLAHAVREIGADPVICRIQSRLTHGQEPPASVAAALKATDVFLTPVNISITHTHAIKEAVAAGARGLVMTQFTEQMLIEGGINADFETQALLCKAFAEVFQQGDTAHLTTPGGTDLHLNLTGRRGNALTGIVQPGEFSTIPTIEANFSPVENSAQGVIVADASVPYLGIGVLKEPIRFHVKDGFITHIEGGTQAEVLRANLASQNDPNVYNIAELGVGLNPQARMCGLMLEDEGVLGVVHIGIGSSLTLGGTIKAKTHYDLLMYGATLTVNNQTLLAGGNITLK